MKLIVVVDMQKEFLNWQPKEIQESLVQDIIKYLNDNEGALIIFTQDSHLKDVYKDYFEFKTYPLHCEAFTENWKIDPRLEEIEHIDIIKDTYSAENGDYWDACDGKEITEIEIVGLTTNICVLANAITLNASFPKASIIIIKDLTYGTSEEERQAAFTCMKSMGMILK